MGDNGEDVIYAGNVSPELAAIIEQMNISFLIRLLCILLSCFIKRYTQ